MIKKNDFIEIDYTGKLADDDFTFDTTEESVAKGNGLDRQGMKYGPKIICVGESQLLKGLDNDVVGKEIGKEYEIVIQPEDGFGKKSAKLIQLVPTSKFKKDKINPVPGLQVNIDNHMGVIKTVTGGRTLVDFNHPLSSQVLKYSYKVSKIITDVKVKVETFMKNAIGLPCTSKFDNGKLTIEMQFPLGDDNNKKLVDKLKTIIPEAKEVVIEVVKPKTTPKAETEVKKEIKEE